MCDNKFWISVWAILGITITTIIWLSTSYWKDHNAKIVEMIGDGVDPVAVICALQDDRGEMPVCLVLAAKSD